MFKQSIVKIDGKYKIHNFMEFILLGKYNNRCEYLISQEK